VRNVLFMEVKLISSTVGAALAFALLVAAQEPAEPDDSAAYGDHLDHIATMNGTCTRLIVAGADATRACTPRVINEVFKNGRTGFTFTESDFAVVSFSGMGRMQIKDDPNKVTQPVDTIIFTLIGMGTAPNKVKAAGKCTYTNTNLGPVRISCSAHTAQGQFEATFLSDGQDPIIKQF
jgi:hypothetical protein